MNKLELETLRLNEMEQKKEIEVLERVQYTNYRCYPARTFYKPIIYKNNKPR